MPTDGTLLLEHMPKEKQYLVTALSVFFSFGAVLSAIVALLVIPQNSCPVSPLPCNVDVQNKGWRYLLIALGLIVCNSPLGTLALTHENAPAGELPLRTWHNLDRLTDTFHVPSSDRGLPSL